MGTGVSQFDLLIDRSSSNAEKYRLRQRLFDTEEVLPMWVADMDLPTPQCVLDAVAHRLTHPVIGYEIMGDGAYEAQIDWMHRRHGMVLKREWLSHSPSVVASIGCAIRAFSEVDDEVIVMDPVYPPFYTMVRHNKRRLLTHPLYKDAQGNYRFDIDRLKSQITSKTRLLLLCSPHNPVGRVWDQEELMALGRLCLEHNIIIVSDEIHSDIVYLPRRHLPIASLSEALALNSVTLIGPGKTFNMAGFSISTVSIPSETLREQYAKERSRVHWGDGNVLAHVGFEAAYAEGEEWFQELMEHLEHNRNRIVSWCKEHPLIECTSPEGSYLAWLDCRKLGLSDRELRTFFIQEAKLGLSPGLSFGKEGSGYMRLNFAVTRGVLEEALERLESALAKTHDE